MYAERYEASSDSYAEKKSRADYYKIILEDLYDLLVISQQLLPWCVQTGWLCILTHCPIKTLQELVRRQLCKT